MPINEHTPGRLAGLPGVLLMLGAGLAQAQDTPDTRTPVRAPGSEIWVGAPIVGDSPCEILANRVCGENRACAGQEACDEVQQWLAQEQEERASAENPRRMTAASGQCQEADRDRKRYSTCSK